MSEQNDDASEQNDSTSDNVALTIMFVAIIALMAWSTRYFWQLKVREEENEEEFGTRNERVMKRKDELRGSELERSIEEAEARVAEAEKALSIAAADGTYDKTRANATAV